MIIASPVSMTAQTKATQTTNHMNIVASMPYPAILSSVRNLTPCSAPKAYINSSSSENSALPIFRVLDPTTTNPPSIPGTTFWRLSAAVITSFHSSSVSFCPYQSTCRDKSSSSGHMSAFCSRVRVGSLNSAIHPSGTLHAHAAAPDRASLCTRRNVFFTRCPLVERPIKPAHLAYLVRSHPRLEITSRSCVPITAIPLLATVAVAFCDGTHQYASLRISVYMRPKNSSPVGNACSSLPCAFTAGIGRDFLPIATCLHPSTSTTFSFTGQRIPLKVICGTMPIDVSVPTGFVLIADIVFLLNSPTVYVFAFFFAPFDKVGVEARIDCSNRPMPIPRYDHFRSPFVFRLPVDARPVQKNNFVRLLLDHSRVPKV